MLVRRDAVSLCLVVLGTCVGGVEGDSPQLVPLTHGDPSLTVDLGVGLWALPLPMDFDEDGDLDLVVACPDKPYNGVYLFENQTGRLPRPVFAPPQRLGPAAPDMCVSIVNGAPRVLRAGFEYQDFRKRRLEDARSLNAPTDFHPGQTRAKQWKYADYDGDGAVDLVVGIGDWTEYGWDDAYNERGEWTNGPLHGYVYMLRNAGTSEEPRYEVPVKVVTPEGPVDVYGRPSPNFADFDGDGDLDLLCGEFLDQFTYFQNVGTRRQPSYAKGIRLRDTDGNGLRMDLQMIAPSSIDWDGDGDEDLIVGDEDGRVALLEHRGLDDHQVPRFSPPYYFQQRADLVKFGALVTPDSYDWDGDGDEDLICGNTAGYIAWIENLDGGSPPRWGVPVRLRAGGEVLRIEAGPHGSIQGPCEAKWGYTTQTVGDWDHDGLPDLVVNSIWGKIVWYRNVGDRTHPQLAAAQPVEVDWPGTPPKPAWNWWNPQPRELVTQWRTTPVIVDFDDDGFHDLVMLDHEGYLCLFRRARVNDQLVLQPGARIFVNEQDEPWRLNAGSAGKSGRRKLCVVDWDGDGRYDVLVNGASANWLRQVVPTHPGQDGIIVLRDMGSLTSQSVAGHTTSPTTVDWNRDGVPELLVGAEDGHLYWMPRRHEEER